MPWINPVKKKMQDGGATFGCWCSSPSPNNAQILAAAGFDWVLIDMEHGGITIERAGDMVMACKGTRAIPLIRVPHTRPEYIQLAQDAGAWGVVVLLVNTAGDARRPA